MCGITGFVSKKINERDLEQFTNCLQHRGPDAYGNFFDGTEGVGLGHRRLSIIDLSTAADQPMYSTNGRFVMVFNGEVYNYQSIAQKLPGHPWKTHSDSEVIIELFAKFGAESFAWLNGMFALGIYDKQEKKLTIARDPVGIKPVYYYADENSFVFCSELKAIKKLYPDLKINKQAIPYFLHLGYIPVPLSIYQNVHKFPSGHYAEIKFENGKPTISNFKSFWKMEDYIAEETIKDEQEAKRQLKDILYPAIERQMISDVPFGTFLSGGIDSSTVTAVASKVAKTKIKTFSIAVVDGKVNEAPYAAAVAKYLGTEHYELPIHQHDILDMVPGLLNVYDEPFGDTSAFPTMLVSKLARQYVTVALSGDGGDEQFMGYGTYTWADRLNHPLLKAFRKPLYAASTIAPAYYKKAGRMLAYSSGELIKSHIFSQDFFNSSELNDLMKENNFSFENINRGVHSSRHLTPKEEQSFWDLAYYLQDDLLVKVDRASMKYSLETRVPLLDLEVIKFSLNVSEDLKVKNGERKYLLKSLLYDLVPASYFDRPKWGFGIALEKVLQKELKPLVEKYFDHIVISHHGILNADKAMKIKERFYGGQGHYYFQVWLITVLHWWMEENA